MSTLQLIKKFRPIFVFSKGEKYYPINKDFMKGSTGNIKVKDTENLTSPQEPVYYHILEEDKEEIAVFYILIFPYSIKGFLNLFGEKGDIVSCLTVINKRTKTLKEIFYWNNKKISFDVKTTRPVIYISANTHEFNEEMDHDFTGLRWEPTKIEDFKLKKLKEKRLEGKPFDKFLSSYRF